MNPVSPDGVNIVTVRCFPRAHRLTRPAQFKRVFAGAVRWSDGPLTFLARPNGLAVPRLGLAIAKRQVKQAVGRNRVKRQIRESFRHHQAALAGLDIVVLARVGIGETSMPALRAVVDRSWQALAERCEKSSSC